MNRYTTFLFFASLFAFNPLFSQDVHPCAQVVATGGQSVEKQGVIYTYTVGEPVIATLFGANLSLSQGFNQPDLCLPSVGTSEPGDLADWQIELFPNPTEGLLHVRFSPDKTARLEARVFDLLGHLVSASLTVEPFGGSELDLTDFPPGVYFLHLQEPATLAASSFRFVKI